MFATVTVKLSVAVAPESSVAVITTFQSPTWSLVGVPVSAPAVHVIQLGNVVQVNVTLSPVSTSDAVVV